MGDIVNAAALDDINEFVALCSQSSRRLIAFGSMKFCDAVRLICVLLGGGPDNPISVRSLGKSMRKAAAPFPGQVNSQSFDFVLLPTLLEQFAHVRISAIGVDTLKASALASLPRPRCLTNAVPQSSSSSSAIVAADVLAPEMQMQAVDMDLSRYSGYDHQELCVMLARRDAELADAKANMHAIQRSRRHFQEMSDKHARQIDANKLENSQLLEQINFKPGTRNCSRVGAYELAWARARTTGSVSSRAVVQLLAGDPVRGGLSDKNIATRHEHFANIAQILKSHEDHALLEALTDAPDVVASHASPTTPACWEAFCIKSDATNQEALDREKIHVATVELAVVGSEAHTIVCQSCSVAEDTDVAGVLQVERTFAAADLQVVHDSTGAETYALMLREMASIGAADWERRCIEASENPARVSMFTFGVDRGSDNVGAARRVKTRLVGVPNVMFNFAWCLLHSLHHIVENVLTVLDGWDWGRESQPQSYFNAVATIANVWRSPGTHKNLQKAASGCAVACRLDRVPGRAIRGRWGAIDGVELIIMKGGTLLTTAWHNVFGYLLAPIVASLRPSARGVAVGADAQCTFQEEQSRWRKYSTRSLSNNCFHVMLRCSQVVKQPLMHFLTWCQKRNGELVKQVKKLGTSQKYMGKTPMSEFVCGKCEELWLQICNLFDDTEHDGLWRCVWDHVPIDDTDLSSRTMGLIVALCLVLATSYQVRMVERASQFPLLLLYVVEAPHYVADATRKAVAQHLLSINDNVLDVNDDDFTLKTKRMFAVELEQMAQTGICPIGLYVHILIFRACLPTDMQDIEGRNSVLQRLASAAPFMKIPLGNARILTWATFTNLYEAN